MPFSRPPWPMGRAVATAWFFDRLCSAPQISEHVFVFGWVGVKNRGIEQKSSGFIAIGNGDGRCMTPEQALERLKTDLAPVRRRGMRGGKMNIATSEAGSAQGSQASVGECQACCDVSYR